MGDLQLEKELELAVGKFFLGLGYFCQKTPKLKTYGNHRHKSPLSLNGSTDLYIIHKGQFWGLEIKLPRGTQSDAQKVFMGHLRSAGGQYHIIRSMADAEAIALALTLV